MIGSQGWIVGVDGIEREIRRRRASGALPRRRIRAGGRVRRAALARWRNPADGKIPAPASGPHWPAGPIPPRLESTPGRDAKCPTMEWPLNPSPLTAGLSNSSDLFKDCNRLPVVQSKRVLWQKQSGKAQFSRSRTRSVEVEGNQYFPPDAIKKEYFKPSATHTVCPWKGTASYYDVEVERQTQSGCGMVLSRAQERGKSDQGLCSVLEGCEGREVVSFGWDSRGGGPHGLRTPGENAGKEPAPVRDRGYSLDG